MEVFDEENIKLSQKKGKESISATAIDQDINVINSLQANRK